MRLARTAKREAFERDGDAEQRCAAVQPPVCVSSGR